MSAKRKTLLLLLPLWVWVSSISGEILDSISPELRSFCTEIGSTHSIIGLGESTHGTKEFTLVRSEMVKELVLRYDFRVFILEAEYIPCSKINAYVRSGAGSPEDLLKDVLLWPWIHRDFLEVIDWIRNYNKRHPFDQVSFLGMDSQLSKIYATRDSILTYYPEKGKSIITIIESESKPKRKIKRLRSLSQEIKKRTKEIDLRLHYYISCRINRLANSSYRDLSARDENMAYFVNLAYEKYGKKIIIWSHNGHISKKKSTFFGKTPAGSHLSKTFENKYSSIAFNFKSGSFNAISYDSADQNEQKVFRLKPIEQTLSLGIDHSGRDMVIVDCSTLQGKNYINAIGAIYVAAPQKGDAFTSKIKKDKQFDYIISLPRSSPTELIAR